VRMHRLRLWAIGLFCASAVAVAVIPAVLAASGWGALVDAFNGTGLRLFQAFAKTPGNIVISPYSIGTAMATVLAGARGDNAAEMAKVLGQKLPGDEINAASAAVLASLNVVSPASFQLRVANALMLTKPGNAVSESYIAVLREKYAAEIFQGADLATVNGWVKEKTNGKIGSILDQLGAMTMLVLLDAIYFKARWQATFDADATRDAAFHLADGEAQVPTMHLRADFALATRRGYQAIRLPMRELFRLIIDWNLAVFLTIDKEIPTEVPIFRFIILYFEEFIPIHSASPSCLTLRWFHGLFR
jgi:serpin B